MVELRKRFFLGLISSDYSKKMQIFFPQCGGSRKKDFLLCAALRTGKKFFFASRNIEK
jgi:hypothetical protein